MEVQKKDITDIKDIEQFVNTFYGKAREDELIGPIFNNAVKDWSHHLPAMYKFWSQLLLGTMDYTGSPFAKHIPLPIEKQHFDRWIQLFYTTLDELFEGPKAAETKDRAYAIAATFEYKLRTIRKLASQP
ncbi:group III truncated hemoglobin [Cytophagaceae bacterium YF14B1]|uniref:Group III truncated hemoglobin n=1 Tax=Xanthocytophaga flava TaxID=3048013 RepID=A0AAE3QQ15_9BACT|nr:group III truncated hemoglobin [Xanthocytophaga flavus]MDJ1480774.1 group III truncated hemoglobin [Xanthocytophaga flavus]